MVDSRTTSGCWINKHRLKDGVYSSNDSLAVLRINSNLWLLFNKPSFRWFLFVPNSGLIFLLYMLFVFGFAEHEEHVEHAKQSVALLDIRLLM